MNTTSSLPGNTQQTSWLSPIMKDARYLRAILTLVSKASEEQLKQVPIIGPLLLGFADAVKELSEQQDNDQSQREIEAKLAALLTQGEQAQRNSEAFAAFARFLLEQQFQQTALLTQLTTHLHALGLPAERKQLTEFACNAALVAYRSRVIRDYQYADQRGIQGVPRSEHVASLPLTDIYVKPRLQSERAADRSLFESRERERELLKQMLDNQDLPTNQQARLEEEFAILTGERWRGKKEQDTTLSIGEALQRVRHTVILGGPGVGKSQLTRYLALVCARGEASMSEQLGWAEELTPIVISLAAFADVRIRAQQAQPLTLRQHLDAELERRGGAALHAAIEQELQAGRVLVLLDGVDEVPDFNQRSAIVVEVENFLRDHGAIRCLVTSRPFGYIRLAGDVAHFELLNFSEEQVGEFIRRWQRAFEEWQHRDAPNYEAAAREAEEMFTELKGNPKVLELATNPLMLVIIALIRYEQTRLPQERVRLYDIAVKTLMETWNFWRSKVAGVNAETQLKTDDLIIVWSAVAEWTRRTKPTGVVHRGELKTKLVEILLAEELGGPKPAETAEAYLDAAARRAGLLEERGPDIFAFWHPTFEEFLAAVKLTTPAHRAKERLLPLRRDPRWREVILLAVGHLGLIQRDRETASELVQALAVDEPDVLEPVLHRHLLLAAACVADDVGVKRNVGEEVIVALGKVVSEQPYEQLCGVFVKTVGTLPRVRLSEQSVAALAHLAEHQNWEVRAETAWLFSNVAAELGEAHRLCERLFEDSVWLVRCHAALGLARTGDLRPEVIAALLHYQNHHHRSVHIEKAFIEFFATADETVSETLFGLLGAEEAMLRSEVALLGSRYNLGAEEAMLRSKAAWLLKKLGRADERVIETVFDWLSAKNAWLRFEAARLLDELGRTDERVIETFFSLLSAEDEFLRHRAARLLEEMGRADERVIQSLFGWLNAENVWLRIGAAWLLHHLACADERVVETLFGWLTDKDAMLRILAGRLLDELGRADKRVSETLFGLLSAEDAELRFEAARLLKDMGHADERVIETLFGLLSAEDVELREKAARLLRQLGRADERVIETLFGWLSAEDARLRSKAARLLDELGRADERVIETLFGWLSAKDAELRKEAARLLKEMARADERVIETLFGLLSAEDAELHAEVARLLREFASEDEKLYAQITPRADPHPWEALAACRKLLHGHPLDADDGQALAELVRRHAGDTAEQRFAREWMFEWLWRKHQPKAQA